MSFDDEALARALGKHTAAALTEWATLNHRKVRLVSPEWTARGYSGATLAAINVGQVGGPDMKLIVKACPPDLYSRETRAYQEARSVSNGNFFTEHLVTHPFDPYRMPDGGLLIFQDIASASFNLQTVRRIPANRLAEACATVTRTLITEWAPSRIRSEVMPAGSFLRRELREALTGGGSIQRWAGELGLLHRDMAWLTDVEDATRPLPNPILMALNDAESSGIRLDISVGPTNGDLHVDNILIPIEHDQLRIDQFRLVYLSTF